MPTTSEGIRGSKPAQAILGLGQIQMLSSNVFSDTSTGEFSFDARVKNLLSSPIGTLNGTTALGSKVFFEVVPYATAYYSPGDTGTIGLPTVDGTATFTAVNQPYYSYAGIVASQGTSAARRWYFYIPRTVKSFAFMVRIYTETPLWRTLRVVAEAGVQGYPRLGDTLVTPGGVVPYSFHAPVGHLLTVYLDSLAVPDSGTVTMGEHHSLLAVLRRDTALREEDQPVYQAIRSYLSSTSPHAPYQAYVNALVALYATHNSAVADSIYLRAADAAIDLVADSASLARVNASLTGHMFTIPNYADLMANRIGSGAFSPARAASSRLHAPNRSQDVVGTDDVARTRIVFVNGIGNAKPDATRSFVSLANKLITGPFAERPDMEYVLVYNPTSLQEDSRGSVGQWCLSKLAMKASSPLGLLARFCKVTSTIYDLGEVSLQTAQSMISIIPTDSVTRALGDSIVNWRAASSNVILVPHSQGNVITSIALNALKRDGRLLPSNDRTCVAAVPIASPTTDYSALPSKYVKPVQLAGDIILHTPGPKFPAIYTQLWDSLARRDSAYMSQSLKPGLIAISQLVLHGMGSYLAQSGGLSALISAVTYADNMCAVVQVTITPQSDSLPVGTVQQMHASAVNGAGDVLANVRPQFGGFADDSGVLKILSRGAHPVSARVRGRDAMRTIIGTKSLPVVLSSSCTKGATTRESTEITTRFTFQATGSHPNSPVVSIARYAFELEVHENGKANTWELAPFGAMVPTGQSGTAYMDFVSYTPYADSPDSDVRKKATGNCRVTLTDTWLERSQPAGMSF